MIKLNMVSLASNSMQIIQSFLFFFCILCFIICSTKIEGKPNIMHGTCYFSDGNYTENSLYHSNLLNAFSKLTSLSSVNSFSNFTVSSNKDRDNDVYSLYNCRYDLSLETCQDCVAEASKKLLQRCMTKEGIVYYEECILRYANRPIVSIMELSQSLDSGCATIGVPDEGEMGQLIESIFKGLIDEATSKNSSRYFAVGERSYSEHQKIYSLVQCTPDITRKECKDCLMDAVNITAPCASSGKLIGLLSGPSCQIRFDFTRFYNLSSGLPPMSSAPGSPPLSKTSDGGHSLKSMAKLSILLIFCFLFSFVFLVDLTN